MTFEKKPAAFDASVLVGLVAGREAVVHALRPVLDAVRDGRCSGIVSYVNVAELQYVAGKMLAHHGQSSFDILRVARIEVKAPNKLQTLLAAEANRKVADFSLGDAFAFALATTEEARLYTTDPAFDHPWVKDRLGLSLIRP